MAGVHAGDSGAEPALAYFRCLHRLPVPRNSADLENGSSRGFPIIVVEHPAQLIAAADAAHLGEARRRLDQIVLDIVKTWRFQPATVNGKPVPTEAEVIVPFGPRYPITG